MTKARFLARLPMTPLAERVTSQTGATAHEDHEHPRAHGVFGEVFLGDLVLALPALAVDDRDPVCSGPGPHPAGEPARQPHQVRVIQLRIRIAVPPPPPGPEPARVMAQRVIRVQHDPVHAVIRAGQQVPVPFGEVIGHALTVEATRTSFQYISRTAP